MSQEKIKVLLSGLVLVCLLLGSYVKPVSGDSPSISEGLADSAKKSSPAEKLMVGIYSASKGGKGIYQALYQRTDLECRMLDNTDFEWENLVNYDVLIFPSLRTIPSREKLRAYVEMGNGIILYHEAIGYQWTEAIFPEIANATGKKVDTFFYVNQPNHPLCQSLPEKIKLSYEDYIILSPGKSVQTVLKDDAGNPVVVCGGFGKGKVVISGNFCGIGVSSDDNSIAAEEMPPTNGELALLNNSIKWVMPETHRDERIKLFKKMGLRKKEELATRLKDLREKTRLLLDDFKYDSATVFEYELEEDLKNIKDSPNYTRLAQRKDDLKREFLAQCNVFEKIFEKLFAKNISKVQTELRAKPPKVPEAKREADDILFSRPTFKTAEAPDEIGEIKRKIWKEIELFNSEIDNAYKELNKQLLLLQAELEKALKPIPAHAKEPFDKDNFVFFEMLGGVVSYLPDYYKDHSTYRPDLSKIFRIMNEQLNTQAVILSMGYPASLSANSKSIYSNDVDLKKIFDLAEKNNVKIFIAGTYIPEERSERKTFYYKSENLESEKKKIKGLCERIGDHSAFAGIMFDEKGNFDERDPIAVAAFKEYLKGKYSSEQLSSFGIKNPDTLVVPGTKQDDPFLWTEYGYFTSGKIINYYNELIEYIHSLDKDYLVWFNQWCANYINPRYGSILELSKIVDIFSVDIYDGIGTMKPYIADLQRSQGEPFRFFVGYNYHRPNWPQQAQIDMSIGYAHTDGISYFLWPLYWKYPPRDKPSQELSKLWKEGTWQVVEGTLSELNEIKEYLTPSRSGANVGLLHSERCLFIEPKEPFITQMGTYGILSQAHVPFEPIYVESFNESNTDRYRILIMNNLKTLTPQEEERIKKWVRSGGILFATGQSSLTDQWGRKQNDYRLKDLFGVSFMEERQLDGIVQMKIIEPHPLLGGLKVTDQISYDARYGYDLVKPTNGRVVASWPDDSPALIINRFGKGKVIFCTAVGLGKIPSVKLDAWEWTTYNYSRRAKYPVGLVEFFSEIVTAGLKETLPFKLENCPKTVEAKIRAQDGRIILHLTNFGYPEMVKPVKAWITVPARKQLKIFYPKDKTKIVDYQRQGNKVHLTIKDFDLHQILVIEY